MSDHAWTQDHVAAFVVGGLTPEEATRLEGHVRDCPECAAAVAAARRVDGGLAALFADARPGPGLEDRAVRAVRAVRPRHRLQLADRLPRLAVAAMILLALGTFGAMAEALITSGRLPMPGDVARRAPDLAVADSSGNPGPVASRMYREIPDEPSAKAHTTPQQAAQASAPNSANGSVPQYLSTQSGNVPPGSGGISGGIGGVPAGTTYSGGTANFYGAGFGPGTGITTLNTDGTVTLNTWGDTHRLSQNSTYQISTGRNAPTGGPGGPQSGSGSAAAPSTATGLLGTFRPGEHRPAAPTLDLGQRQPEKDVKDQAAPKPSAPPPPAGDAAPPTNRVVIRSGEMEFEVDSFDAAAATITRLVTGLRGAFVATVNSEKLANGKVRGSVTVRTPPEHLDRLILDLRRELGGELKGMRIGSQDVTKQYTDLESRLRAARTMEQRLLQIIKDGKGEVKDLLAAEKELGVWRTKIEELEGEIRYYANLAALSTLTVTLTEKEIRAAAAVTESERVQAGVEVEDVEAAYQQALAAVAAAKGRVTKAEMKQFSAGQFNAALHFAVPPDAAGPVRDRLRQLGRVARLEIDRVQTAVGGAMPADGKLTRGDTLFLVQLYNLANVAPRETVAVTVAAPDVRAAYQAVRDAATKAAGRLAAADLNEQDAQNVTGRLDVEVRRPEEAALRTALDAAGEVVARQVSRAAEGENATDTKVLYRVTFIAVGRLAPRETTTLTVEVPDVDQAAGAFAAQVAEAHGRQLAAHTERERSGKVTARLTYEVPLAAAGLVERLKAAGIVRSHQSTRDPQAPAGKYATARLDVTLVSGEPIVAGDDGLWPPVRRGLSYSAAVLLTSLTWVVFGLCVVLPWAVAGYVGYRLVRRLARPARPATVAPPAQG